MNNLLTKMKSIMLLSFLLVFANGVILADSGGVLIPQQAAFDVEFYDLDLSIDLDGKSIAGSLTAKVKILENDTDSLVLDLNDNYTIDSILVKKNLGEFEDVEFTRENGRIFINIPDNGNIDDLITCSIFYFGIPVEASNPPWTSGFVWDQTPSGDHWVGVACEHEGADSWWPCKDHPSDEPDSMAIHFTVPNPYICASNGQLLSTVDNGDGTTTFNWFVSTPINNYNVTLYISDYMLIEDDYSSVSGETIPFKFWVLPEVYDDALAHMPVFLAEFDFLESVCGPFPFGMDKHGWAHSPYWGMEHQTIIAYDNDFYLNSWGFDYIHLHELAHEWWGNLITAKNWADIWIHEGLGTYMEALYVESISDIDTYHDYMDGINPGGSHSYFLAPFEPTTSMYAFSYLNPYYRGAWTMHTLRYHIGDENFFNLLKHWTYSNSTNKINTNNKDENLCKLFDTEDMKNLAEELLNIDLDPFFDVFFREENSPHLLISRADDYANLTWITENNVLLDLNVPITINGNEEIVEMNAGQGTISVSIEDDLVVDPDQWILMEEPVITDIESDNYELSIMNYELKQNYPNPFNPITRINYELRITDYELAEIVVYNSLGQQVWSSPIINHSSRVTGSTLFNGSKFNSGIYYYALIVDNKQLLRKKMILIK